MRSGIGGFVALLGVLAVMGCASAQEKDYLREANAICAAADKRLDALPRPSSMKKVAKVAKEETAIRKEVVSQLGELPPPVDISGGADNVFKDQEARHERAHATEKAAAKKDEKELRKIREEAKTEHPVEVERAMAVGLRECADL